MELNDDRYETLSSYLNHAAATNLTRGGFFTSVGGIAVNPSDVDGSDVLETTKRLKQYEDEYEKRASEVEPILSEVDLPARMELPSVSTDRTWYPKGTTFALDVVASNVGNEDATSVSLAVDAASLDANPSSVELGRIGADESVSKSVSIAASTSGQYSLTVQVSSDSAGEPTKGTEVEVLSKDDVLDLVVRKLSETNGYVSDSDVPKGAKRSLSKKLSNAEQKVERAISFVERGQPKQANNQLTAVSNILGATLNSLDGKQNGASEDGNGKGGTNRKSGGNGERDANLPTVFAQKVTQEVEGILDLLADAREAQI